jgi:hypothetical protein
MSSFLRYTRHPVTGKWEKAAWIDDYYGMHHYGCKFSDESVYDPWKVKLSTGDLTDHEVQILNRYKDVDINPE